MLKGPAAPVASRKVCYVYCWRNKRNGKRYFGKGGCGSKTRATDHAADAARGVKSNLLVKAMMREGIETFELQYVLTGLEEHEALKVERFYVRRFRTNVHRYGWKHGYNQTDGGEGVSGFKLSSSAKKRLAELATSDAVSFLRHNVETVLFMRALGTPYHNIALQLDVAQSSLSRVLHESCDASKLSAASRAGESLRKQRAPKISKRKKKAYSRTCLRSDFSFLREMDHIVQLMPTVRFIVKLGYVERTARFFGISVARFRRLLALCSR